MDAFSVSDEKVNLPWIVHFSCHIKEENKFQA